MVTKVYNNVEGHRVIDNGLVVEDVTSITVPTIKHTSSKIDSSGMVAAVEMPDMTHLEAMEFEVAHNNGVNCNRLGDPGKHMLEVRVARQKYNVATGEIGLESVKFRMTGVHSSTDKGKVEQGNPWGSTDKYACLRFEEEINGEIVTLVDAMAGIIKVNGVTVTDTVESILS
ncbi:MAG: hypothetical protein GXY67_07930 [Clostridiales bacterium]|nr:hypothetical protein [Clostridiales bacterium]